MLFLELFKRKFLASLHYVIVECYHHFFPTFSFLLAFGKLRLEEFNGRFLVTRLTI